MQIANHTIVTAMDLANCVTLYLFLICLSLCSGYGVLIDSKDGADKQNEMQAHVKTVRTPALVRDGGGGSSGGYSSGDDYDDDPPTVCAGGLGYYQDVGPSSCCCQPCGPGAGPVKLPDRDALDPDEDSCCPIDTTVEAEAHWGCCNCPDGLWILRWNSSEDPKMDYKQPNHLERESVHKLVKLAHKIFRINHEKQGNKPKGDEPETELSEVEKLAQDAFIMNYKKQDSGPTEDKHKPTVQLTIVMKKKSSEPRFIKKGAEANLSPIHS